MTKAKAIAKKCLDCSGGSPKEVTLCHVFDCPLWEYRCGCGIKSRQYQERMKRAMESYKQDLSELRVLGVDTGVFLKSALNRAFFAQKRAKLNGVGEIEQNRHNPGF